MYNKKQCIQLVLDANKLVIIDQKVMGVFLFESVE